MKLVKVKDYEREGKMMPGTDRPSGAATVLCDVETGKLYYCERMREGTVQQIHGWINNPPYDAPQS